MIELGKIGLGAIDERFRHVLCDVIENILDPNTDAKTARKITIDMKISPDPENREKCDFEVVVKSKLAPAKAHQSMLFVGIDENGEMDSQEVGLPEQGRLFADAEAEKANSKIHDLKKTVGGTE